MCKPGFLNFFFFSLLVIAFGSPASAETARPTQNPEGPISIRSEKMTAKNSDNRVVFEDNVVVTKGDLWMRADRMEVFFDPGGVSSKSGPPLLFDSQGAQEIQRIVAVGNVSVKQGERRAKAEQAVYDQREEKIVLTGNPETWEKDYKVTGTKMTFFLKEQRSIVEQSKMLIQNAGK
jgi:lipopolysaccharide export system protein LptA